MRKQIEKFINALKYLLVDIDNKKVSAADATNVLLNLVLEMEKFLEALETTTEEKLDFLIFMQSKIITTPDKNNPMKRITGEDMFEQWKEARAKADDIENCKCHCHCTRLDGAQCKCLKNCVHCRPQGSGGAGESIIIKMPPITFDTKPLPTEETEPNQPNDENKS